MENNADLIITVAFSILMLVLRRYAPRAMKVLSQVNADQVNDPPKTTDGNGNNAIYLELVNTKERSLQIQIDQLRKEMKENFMKARDVDDGISIRVSYMERDMKELKPTIIVIKDAIAPMRTQMASIEHLLDTLIKPSPAPTPPPDELPKAV
jgi:hypothetical protein